MCVKTLDPGGCAQKPRDGVEVLLDLNEGTRVPRDARIDLENRAGKLLDLSKN